MKRQQIKNLKYIVTLLLFSIQFSSFSQEYKKYIPYEYENLWGIIDSTQQVVIEPQYKEIRIIGKLEYVQFDGKTLIDIATGKEIPNAGEYRTSVVIEGDEYYLFNGDKKSVLIDLKKKDTISLSLQYNYMSELILTDSKTKKEYQYILGQLGYEKYVLLKNTKNLPLAISAKSVPIDVLRDDESMSNVGVVIKKGAKSLVYNPNAQLKKTFNHAGSFDLLTEKQLESLAPLFGKKKLILPCISCAEATDNSWYINEQSQLPKAIQLKQYSDSVVFLKTDKTTTIEGYANTLSVDYGALDVNAISGEGITIIVDSRYVQEGKLMFPKGILIED